MSIVMYTTAGHNYFYAAEIGQPESTVLIGEGFTPAEAATSLQPTQYQSADFRCRGPSNPRMREVVNSMETVDVGPLEDCTAEEEAEAQDAYSAAHEEDAR